MITTKPINLPAQPSQFSPMTIVVYQKQARVPVTILRPMERINLGNTEQLLEKAREIHDQGARYLLLDLTDVPSITSAGLRTIQIIFKLFEVYVSPEGKDIEEGIDPGRYGRATRMKLFNPTSEVRRILNLAGFDKFIEIYSDWKDALQAF
jgi:anti-anti-sigma regulatory factor